MAENVTAEHAAETTDGETGWEPHQNQDGFLIYNDAGNVVAFVHADSIGGDSIATLVSAAPDLLAVAEAVTDEWRKKPSEQNWTRVANLATDALVKATPPTGGA